MTSEQQKVTPPRFFERVRLVKMQPPGHTNTAAFDDTIDIFEVCLKRMGSIVDRVVTEPFLDDGVNLIFGADLVAPAYVFPPNCVLVNLEQLGGRRLSRRYVERLTEHPTLDYSAVNLRLLAREFDVSNVHLYQIGYTPEMTRIVPAPVQDVDVLFYGVVNERRRDILDGLVAAGIKLKVLENVYGAERDVWVARSKLVLNIRYYESKRHEIVRTSYLLANRKAVVTECDPDTDIDLDIKRATVAVPVSQLVDACRALLADDEARHAIERRGFEIFSRRDQTESLRAALSRVSFPIRIGADINGGGPPHAQDSTINSMPPVPVHARDESSRILQDHSNLTIATQDMPTISNAEQLKSERGSPNWRPAGERAFLTKYEPSRGHSGLLYLQFMGLINSCIQPRTYLEIGTSTGDSLKQFTCDAICVDPKFRIESDVLGKRRRTFFFQQTSDAFFRDNNPATLFPEGIDAFFLDGLHHFEALLRDFANSEKYSHARSFMFIHDCLPTRVNMTTRTYNNDLWTGDVWKFLLILKKYRPELRIALLDCSNTGLVLCTGLNNASSVLKERYYEILDEFIDMKLDDAGLASLTSLYPYFDTRKLAAATDHLPLLFG